MKEKEINENTFIEIHIKVRLNVSDIKKASKISLDNIILTDCNKNEWYPFMGFGNLNDNVDYQSTEPNDYLLTDNQISYSLGFEIYEYSICNVSIN